MIESGWKKNLEKFINQQYPDIKKPTKKLKKNKAKYFGIIFTNPSARTGYDTRSIFKRSLTGLNSEFSFS